MSIGTSRVWLLAQARAWITARLRPDHWGIDGEQAPEHDDTEMDCD